MYCAITAIVEYLNLAAVSTFNLILYLVNLPKKCTCVKNSQVCAKVYCYKNVVYGLKRHISKMIFVFNGYKVPSTFLQ